MKSVYEQRGWPLPDEIGKIGKFLMISKHQIEVKPEYQRDQSRQMAKIKRIQASFNWPSFGVLIVSQRCDKFFCIDGSGRLTAVLQRPDVDMVPCIVYTVASSAEEAQIFLFINKNRSGVSSSDTHIASVEAGDAVSLEIERLSLMANRPIDRASGPNTISCVKKIKKIGEENIELLRQIFPFLCELEKDEVFDGRIVDAVWRISKKYGFEIAFDKRAKAKLLSIGHKEILRNIVNYIAATGKATGADALLDLINKGKKQENRLGV